MTKRNGSDTAQRAMGVLFMRMDRAAKLIEASPATTEIRAKTLAAIWRFIPSTSQHGGFEFDDTRCVEGTNGLSELDRKIPGSEGLDGGVRSQMRTRLPVIWPITG